jgi:hypothetical protein
LIHPARLILAALATAALLCRAMPAWAWGNQGHEIVAIIAADYLTPAAQSHVAEILGAADTPDAIAHAMAEASILPDTEFRDEYRATAPWHFIDICLQDTPADLPARCPGGACVTAKIDDYVDRLRAGRYDNWGPSGDLAFVIHLVGDVHQPLHATTDADEGGNCIEVTKPARARNLHALWDNTLVYRLEDHLDARGAAATAHDLEHTYAAEQAADVWHPSSANDIAWESHQIARTEIYGALHLPVEQCPSAVHGCFNAPRVTLDLDDSYLDHASVIAGHQLAKAGFRLASLLNGIWSAPATAMDSTH